MRREGSLPTDWEVANCLSWPKVAMRSPGGTNFGPPCSVAALQREIHGEFSLLLKAGRPCEGRPPRDITFVSGGYSLA